MHLRNKAKNNIKKDVVIHIDRYSPLIEGMRGYTTQAVGHIIYIMYIIRKRIGSTTGRLLEFEFHMGT